jgi:hypothetical protein
MLKVDAEVKHIFLQSEMIGAVRSIVQDGGGRA